MHTFSHLQRITKYTCTPTHNRTTQPPKHLHTQTHSHIPKKYIASFTFSNAACEKERKKRKHAKPSQLKFHQRCKYKTFLVLVLTREKSFLADFFRWPEKQIPDFSVVRQPPPVPPRGSVKAAAASTALARVSLQRVVVVFQDSPTKSVQTERSGAGPSTVNIFLNSNLT